MPGTQPTEPSRESDEQRLSEADGVDSRWYFEQYPDLVSGGMDAPAHYLNVGWKEGKNPTQHFSTTWYLLEYPDVRLAGLNPYLHYLRYGKSEGRSPKPKPPWATLADSGMLFLKLGQEGCPLDEPFGSAGRRKIVFTGHDASRTGAPLILLKLIEDYAGRNADEIFIFLLRDGPLREEYRKFGHVIIDAPHRPGLRREISSLVEGLAAPLPSAAICNSVECWQLMSALHRANIRVISLVHENLRRYSADTITTLLDSSDEIVFPATAMKAIAEQLESGFSRGRVVPQGLLRADFGRNDRSKARALVRQELGIAPDAKLVLACGTRELRKGFDVFHQLAGTTPEAHFLWLGGVDTHNVDLQNWAYYDRQTFGNLDRVTILPSTRDPECYFLAADVFTLTSRDDPFPCVVHEAMAASLPVVVFAGSGGAQEAVEGCGKVVPYLDVREMSAAVTELLANPTAAAAVSQRAEARVRERYRFDDYAGKIFELIDGQLPQRPKVASADLGISHKPATKTALVLACDDNFIAYASVVARRAVFYAREKFPIIIVSDGITDENKALARRFCPQISFIEASHIFGEQQFPLRDPFTRVTYMRLFLDEILADFDFATYIDSDVSPLTDLSPLLAMRPKIGPVMATYDLFQVLDQNIYDRLPLSRTAGYLQGGVQVFDLKAIRQEHVFKDAIQFAISHPDKCELVDQDALNVTLNGRWQVMDWRWNVLHLCVQRMPRPHFIRHLTGGINPGGNKPWEASPKAGIEKYLTKQWRTDLRKSPWPDKFHPGPVRSFSETYIEPISRAVEFPVRYLTGRVKSDPPENPHQRLVQYEQDLPSLLASVEETASRGGLGKALW